MLHEAIETYHQLLTPDIAHISQQQLASQIKARNLFLENRPRNTILRPRFLTTAQYRFIRHRTQIILRALLKIHQRGIKDTQFRAQFALTDWEQQLIEHNPGYTTPTPISRLDAFYMPETNLLQFTEYNADTPAAPTYNDVLTAVFFGLPIMREFLRHYVVYTLPARHGVLHALLNIYQQWAGQHSKPHIAIVDWPDTPNYSELLLFETYFKAQGFDCIITSPNRVEYSGGKLIADGFQIDLIFKRIRVADLIAVGGTNHPIIKAVLDGAVCMANPFNCKMLYKKVSLAMLSNEQHEQMFDAEELKAIADHVPWSRRVEERTTIYDGRSVDLIPFIAENRDNLVLKPNDDQRGRGIVLGWCTSQTDWEYALNIALETPYIVQERVSIPQEPYPSLINNELRIFNRMLDTTPFAFHGDTVYGCLTRLYDNSLINVTARDGASIPTFLIEER